MDIKVLGTGCANCRTTIALIEQMAQAKGVAVNLQKVEELRDIMSYGVMSTPGVVIDGKVVHAGGVPGATRSNDGWPRKPEIEAERAMTNDFNAVRLPSARRHILVVTVFALAAAAGAISYVLMERATAPAPDVQYVAEVDDGAKGIAAGEACRGRIRSQCLRQLSRDEAGP